MPMVRESWECEFNCVLSQSRSRKLEEEWVIIWLIDTTKLGYYKDLVIHPSLTHANSKKTAFILMAIVQISGTFF